jgi:hypothetical protein
VILVSVNNARKSELGTEKRCGKGGEERNNEEEKEKKEGKIGLKIKYQVPFSNIEIVSELKKKI